MYPNLEEYLFSPSLGVVALQMVHPGHGLSLSVPGQLVHQYQTRSALRIRLSKAPRLWNLRTFLPIVYSLAHIIPPLQLCRRISKIIKHHAFCCLQRPIQRPARTALSPPLLAHGLQPTSPLIPASLDPTCRITTLRRPKVQRTGTLLIMTSTPLPGD